MSGRRAAPIVLQLPREAVDPAKVRVHKTRRHRHGDRVEGRPPERMDLPLAARCLPLRHLPRSARGGGSCAGRAKGRARKLLPMYEAPPRPNSVEPAGRYAVVFQWNDGHSSGIYSWDFLRRHCQCEECRREPRLIFIALGGDSSGSGARCRAGTRSAPSR